MTAGDGCMLRLLWGFSDGAAADLHIDAYDLAHACLAAWQRRFLRAFSAKTRWQTRATAAVPSLLKTRCSLTKFRDLSTLRAGLALHNGCATELPLSLQRQHPLLRPGPGTPQGSLHDAISAWGSFGQHGSANQAMLFGNVPQWPAWAQLLLHNLGQAPLADLLPQQVRLRLL